MERYQKRMRGGIDTMIENDIEKERQRYRETQIMFRRDIVIVREQWDRECVYV